MNQNNAGVANLHSQQQLLNEEIAPFNNNNNQQQQQTADSIINQEYDASQQPEVEGYVREEDGAFIQQMPDGMQFVYHADGSMGYILPDGTYNPIDAEEFGAMMNGGGDNNNINNNYGDQSTTTTTPQAHQSNTFGAPPSAQQTSNNEEYDQYNFTNMNQQQQQYQQQTPSPDANMNPYQLQRQQQYNVDQQQQQNQQEQQQSPNATLPPAPGIPSLSEADPDATSSYGYWPKLFTEIFCSTAFKLYFCLLLWNSAVIYFFTGINWMFGSLSRVYHPPVSANADWQSVGFLGIFIVVSMLVATVLTLIIDLTKEAWRVEKSDTNFWGFSFILFLSTCSSRRGGETDEEFSMRIASSDYATRPPYFVYATLVILLTVVPFFWSIGHTVQSDQNGMKFASYFSYSAHVLVLILILAMYVWMYILSLKAKWTAAMNHTSDPMDDEDEDDSHITLRRAQELDQEREMMIVDEHRRRRQEGQQHDLHDNNKQQHQQQSTPETVVAQKIQLGERPYRRWYRSPALLMELGLDARSVRWSVFSFIFGFLGVMVVATILATQEIQPTLGAAWVVALVFFIITLAVMLWVTKRGKRISIYTNAVFILVFFVLVMIGCGSSPFEGMFALFLVPFVLLQGMLLRKVEYSLRKHEVEAIFGGSVEEIKPKVDTYILTGKRFIIALLSYFFDIRGIFGARHPQVKLADRQYRRDRMSLYMDVRVLFHLWLVFWFMLSAISSFTGTLPWPSISIALSVPKSLSAMSPPSQTTTTTSTTMAPMMTNSTLADNETTTTTNTSTTTTTTTQTETGTSTSTSTTTTTTTTTPSPDTDAANAIYNSFRFGNTLQSASFPFCQYSAGNNASFSVYDLALMAILAESAGDSFTTDFINWFGNNSKIEIRPNAESITSRFPASNARQPEFLDFYNKETKSHAIVVRAAANRGGTLLRNLDMMGDSAAYQLAALFAPTIGGWDINERRAFVAGIADVKLVASNSNVTGDIDSYLQDFVISTLNKTDPNERHSAVVVGFGFNGAIAAIAGAVTETPVVTFNAPGTSLLAEKYDINSSPTAHNSRRHSLHMRTTQSLVGLLGESDDLGATHILACDGEEEQKDNSYSCESIPGIARTIGQLCGDRQEKYVNGKPRVVIDPTK